MQNRERMQQLFQPLSRVMPNLLYIPPECKRWELSDAANRMEIKLLYCRISISSCPNPKQIPSVELKSRRGGIGRVVSGRFCFIWFSLLVSDYRLASMVKDVGVNAINEKLIWYKLHHPCDQTFMIIYIWDLDFYLVHQCDSD